MRDINIDILNPRSIEAGIAALEAWKQEIEWKVGIVQQRVVDLLVTYIQSNLAVAEHDLVELRGMRVYTSRMYDVTVSEEGNGAIITVVSKSADPKTGEMKPDIAFVEFGAGQYASGHSVLKEFEEEVVGEFSIKRGSYGKHLGLNDKWYFSSGYSSTGTPQSDAIALALLAVSEEVDFIVEEVFG